MAGVRRCRKWDQGDCRAAVSGPRFEISGVVWRRRRAALGPGRSNAPEYDVSAEGDSFLMIKTPASARGPSHFNVVVNWFTALTRSSQTDAWIVHWTAQSPSQNPWKGRTASRAGAPPAGCPLPHQRPEVEWVDEPETAQPQCAAKNAKIEQIRGIMNWLKTAITLGWDGAEAALDLVEAVYYAWQGIPCYVYT